MKNFFANSVTLGTELACMPAKSKLTRQRRPHSMASCVTQAQVAHRSLVRPNRLRADGFLGRWPLALRRERPAVKPTWSGHTL